MRCLLLAATIGCGLATIAKVLQLALTPEAWAVLSNTGRALLESDAVGFLLVATAILFLLSLCAAAWNRAERRCERQKAAGICAAYLVETYRPRPDQGDSSLRDDSPQGPLPDAFRAPCGEPLRFPTQTDRGPRAA